MSFQFAPAVVRLGTIFRMPRPVVSLRVSEAWDFERFKVPLRDGDHCSGHSRQGVDIHLEGQIGSHDGALRLSEQEMFETLEELRAGLDVGSDDEKYELFLYLDEDSETYRKFKRCSSVRLDYDLSNPHLFTYSAVIHAEDPIIYDSAPGA